MALTDDPTQRDVLEDFDARELSFLGKTRTVFVSGDGPTVIRMAEMTGIHPLVCSFAPRAGRRLFDIDVAAVR